MKAYTATMMVIFKVGVGETLFNYYKDEDKIRKLMKLGDMSSLGTEPIDNPNAWNDTKMLKESILSGMYAQTYSQMHPDNMCDTYATRGDDSPSIVSHNIDEYKKLTYDCWGEYCYLFKDGKWKELFNSTED